MACIGFPWPRKILQAWSTSAAMLHCGTSRLLGWRNKVAVLLGAAWHGRVPITNAPSGHQTAALVVGSNDPEAQRPTELVHIDVRALLGMPSSLMSSCVSCRTWVPLQAFAQRTGRLWPGEHATSAWPPGLAWSNKRQRPLNTVHCLLMETRVSFSSGALGACCFVAFTTQ